MSWTPKGTRKTGGAPSPTAGFNFKRTNQSSTMRARLQQQQKAKAEQAKEEVVRTAPAKTSAPKSSSKSKATPSPKVSVKVEQASEGREKKSSSPVPKKHKSSGGLPSSIAPPESTSNSPRRSRSSPSEVSSATANQGGGAGNGAAVDIANDAVVTWLPINIEKGYKPPPRQMFIACKKEPDELLIFGGCDEDKRGLLNDLHTINLNSETTKWQRVTNSSGKQPPPMAGAAAVLTSPTELMVFGGLVEAGTSADIYTLKLDSMTWSRLKASGDGPRGVYGHTANFLESSDSVLVYGGSTSADGISTATAYLFEIGTMSWRPMDLPGAPAGRVFHTATRIGDHIYMFGGTKDGVTCSNEFYCLDTKRFAWYRLSNMGGPSPRMQHVAVDLNGYLVIHGGRDQKGAALKDVFCYDIKGKAWRELQSNGVFATERSGHASIAIAQNAIICAGTPFSASADVHAFVLGSREIKVVKAKEESKPNPVLEAQRKQLQMLEENVDYKKKYYEIYSIFLELQAIAEKSIPSDASDTPELNPTEAMAMLKERIDCGFAKLNKTHEEQQRRVMDVAMLAAQVSSGASKERKKEKDRDKEKDKEKEKDKKPRRPKSRLFASDKSVISFERSDPVNLEFTRPATPSAEELEAKKEEERKHAEMIANETPEQKEERLRMKVLEEILATEEDHVRDLIMITEVFIRGQHNLAPHEITGLFGNLESIVPVNQQLLDGLQKLVKLPSHEQRVGDLFREIADYLKMYAAYCAGQGKSLDTLNLLRKHNPAFAVFLQMCQADPRCRKLDLESFLIKPMQRICRYPLLLKELLKRTPETHPDYESLKLALEKVQAVVATVNEKKRESENQEKVMMIQLAMVWQGDPYFLATPTRRLLKQETVYRLDGAKKSKVELMLFNDLIIIAKAKGDKLLEKGVLDMNGCILWNIKDPKCAFCIRKSHDKHGHNLLVSSEAAKAEWMDLITECITKVLFSGKEGLGTKALDDSGKSLASLTRG